MAKKLLDVKAYQWCNININNEFIFMDSVFVLDDSVKEYRVYNKSSEVEDFTNEAHMDKVLVVLANDNTIRFFNQSNYQIDSELITVQGGESK